MQMPSRKVKKTDGVHNLATQHNFFHYIRSAFYEGKWIRICEHAYPSVMLFLESGQDIPGRPSEYVSLCGNDLDKSEAYLKEMELRDFFDYYSWIAETIGPPSDDDGKARFYYLRNFLLLCVNKKRLPH